MPAACDLVVIGGGINGAGIARDAALRGLSVCLLEQDDLCSSTTRWSSRLIHGGLRYLEFGELGLVHESLRERETLLAHAPHLVRPLPLVIPVYRHGKRGLNTVDFGLWIYDLLSVGRSVPGHSRLSAADTLAEAPGLDASGLVGGVRYHDAQVVYPERLVVENAVDAQAAGARILTGHRVRRVLAGRGHVQGVEACGAAGPVSVEARAVVNAAGPWVDSVLRHTGGGHARLLDPTRGTHLVLERIAGAPDSALYVEARADGRPFFILPWNDLSLVGTTDIRHRGDPGAARPTAAEVDYLLAELNALFPAAAYSRADVLYAYAGVRPLPRQGPRQTAAITRRHLVRRHAGLRGLYSVIGGKLTTYRALAEDVVDQVVAGLGRQDVDAGPCVTAETALPGARESRGAVMDELAQVSGLGASSARHLWDVYGSRATGVTALARSEPALLRPICPHSHAIGAEVVHAFEAEFARTLADVLFRRSMAGLSRDRGRAAWPAALEIARDRYDWDDARCASEEEAWRRECEAFDVPGTGAVGQAD